MVPGHASFFLQGSFVICYDSLHQISPSGWVPLEELLPLLKNICWCFHPPTAASIFYFFPVGKPPEGKSPVWAPCPVRLLGQTQRQSEHQQGDQDLEHCNDFSQETYYDIVYYIFVLFLIWDDIIREYLILDWLVFIE